MAYKKKKVTKRSDDGRPFEPRDSPIVDVPVTTPSPTLSKTPALPSFGIGTTVVYQSLREEHVGWVVHTIDDRTDLADIVYVVGTSLRRMPKVQKGKDVNTWRLA